MPENKKLFQQIASGLGITELLELVESNPDWWLIHQERQNYPGTSHAETECIYLRGPTSLTPEEYIGNPEAVYYPVPKELQEASEKLLGPLFEAMEVEELGYILIVKLKPDSVVYPHIDEGAYSDHYSRFHLALSGGPEEALIVEGEEVHMEPGEVWWFNHKCVHCADNPHDYPRIHIIFDAVTKLVKHPSELGG